MPEDGDLRRGRPWRAGLALPPGVGLSYLVKILAVLSLAFLSYEALRERIDIATQTALSTNRLEQVETVLSKLADAESGQRGYLLTGEDRYLQPYHSARSALASAFAALRGLVLRDPTQLGRVDHLEQLATQKLAELRESIELFQHGHKDEALARVRGDGGTVLMESARDLVSHIEHTERERLQLASLARKESVGSAASITFGGLGLLLALIAVSIYTSRRSFRQLDDNAWLRAGETRLGSRLAGDAGPAELADRAVRFLADHLEAPIGAVQVLGADGSYQRLASFALTTGSTPGERTRPGEGLVGQAARERRTLEVADVPEAYFAVTSSLGSSKPRHLVVVPARTDHEVPAVIELGFFRAVGPVELQLLDRASEMVGTAFRSARYRERQAELLEESQRQAEELQESQAQLEDQQRELEETNAQLEEQTRTLESQKEGLVASRLVLEQQAARLEQTSRYKSEFLANMSHELRTPLNSLLILAKLLADNKEGNLTSEQVGYAQRIDGAGHDLLALINDILDLSKIEARKIELQRERVSTAALLEELRRRFEPLAADRRLELVVAKEDPCPDALDTDGRRLQQVLTNLLSNALKFTEQGRVRLSAGARGPRHVVFTVEDTGIGIAAEHQEIIFEAFRQADGTTNRKYGGTGLGLSISRELASMLGGHIELQSAPGMGSTFSVVLPLAAEHETSSVLEAPRSRAPARAAVPKRPLVEDDREVGVGSGRTLLIIEDDAAFAQVLRDLGREQGFRCVIAGDAGEALRLAREHPPVAVILDIGLPDDSGMSVLEHLKRDASTRHVPIHVVSAHDYQRVALEMGAVGYALKPVKREQLVSAFHALEARLARSARRVLIVEDDAVQRDAIVGLLRADGVELVAVETADAALAQLRSTTFDCCVLDLGLPGRSGFDLLDEMAQDERSLCPPVIIYTARAVSQDDELRLRRHARSIIVKGARSPERLLEEVTLFLHHLEASLAPEQQRMLRAVRDRDTVLEDRRILLVEDDARNIFAVSKLLEPKGAIIEIARNGKEALARIARAPRIDLVLMDLMMPEMDGLTATRELRKLEGHAALPIIAMTSKAMPDDRAACLKAGANDYVSKPIDVEKLLSLLRVWMPR